MIKVKQVLTGPMGAELVIDYDDLDMQNQPTVKTARVDLEEVRERLKTVKRLTGLDPTEETIKNILKTLINEIRTHRRPTLPRYDYTRLIGLDLEEKEIRGD